MSVLRDIRDDISNDERKSTLSEKQMTKRATHQNVEEFYTLNDIVHSMSSLDDKIGYPFDYPFRWLQDDSQDKRIGIRRLECTPSAHAFELGVSCYDANDNLVGTIFSRLDIRSDDDIIDIMHYLCSTFTPRDANDNTLGSIKFFYYDAKQALALWYEDANKRIGKIIFRGNTHICEYLSISQYRMGESGIVEFLKMLNQNVDMEGEDTYDPDIHDLQAPLVQNVPQNYVQTVGDTIGFLDDALYPNFMNAFRRLCAWNNNRELMFENVWNRKTLYFHSSFSTSKRKLIGKNYDFYPSLSQWYPAPTNETTFYVQLSSNGIRKIFLRYCNIDIQLCFCYH